MWFIILLWLALIRRVTPPPIRGVSARPEGGEIQVTKEAPNLDKYWGRLPTAGMAAIRAHFDEKDWAAMAGLSWYESRNIETAHRLVANPPPGFLPEDSRGPWQINVIAWPQFANTNLYNWENNAAAARVVLDEQGFSAWLISSRKLGLIDA